jgi:hypothetical protein
MRASEGSRTARKPRPLHRSSAGVFLLVLGARVPVSTRARWPFANARDGVRP